MNLIQTKNQIRLVTLICSLLICQAGYAKKIKYTTVNKTLNTQKSLSGIEKVQVKSSVATVIFDHSSDQNIYIQTRVSGEQRSNKIIDFEREFAPSIVTKDNQMIVDFKKNEGSTGFTFFSWRKDLETTKNIKDLKVTIHIKLPQTMPIMLKNDFGKASFTARFQEVKVALSSGILTFDTIDFMHGKVSFSKVNGKQSSRCVLNASSGSLSIDEVKDLEVDCSFAKIQFEQVGNMTVKANSGTLKVGSVNRIEGTASFTSLALGQAMEYLNLKLRSGSLNLKGNGKHLNLKLEASYSKILFANCDYEHTGVTAENQYGRMSVNGFSDYPSKQLKLANSNNVVFVPTKETSTMVIDCQGCSISF